MLLSSFITLYIHCGTTTDQEWWNVSSTGRVRTVHPNPSPFKRGRPSPLRSIPGGDSPYVIKPDLMHVFHIGIGGDLAASCLYALCRMHVFGDDGFPKRLDQAFERFDRWCSDHHYTSSVRGFENATFKVKVFRGQTWKSLFVFLNPWGIVLRFLPIVHLLSLLCPGWSERSPRGPDGHMTRRCFASGWVQSLIS